MPKPNEGQETQTETQSDFDMEAATAELSQELFGQGNDGGKEKTTEGEDQHSDVTETGVDAAGSPQLKEGEEVVEAPKPKEDENSAAVQEIGAPKTWTKEALEKWATLDPVVQAEITKRETDFLNGIQGYKALADQGAAYGKVVEPYAPILAAENIDPVGLFQSFAANHYILSRGTEEQKLQLTAQLLDGYKIPLGPLLEYMAKGNMGTTETLPEISALRKELDELKSGIDTRNNAERDRIQAQIRAEIDAFAADPAHPHFDELGETIQKLFASKQVSTLQEAYDQALLLNPQTRQAELDRLTAEKIAAAKTEENERRKKARKSTADHVNVSSHSRDGTVPKGSIDDTLAETLATIEARG